MSHNKLWLIHSLCSSWIILFLLFQYSVCNQLIITAHWFIFYGNYLFISAMPLIYPAPALEHT